MLNLTAQKVIADNVVVMNGVEIGRLTDADARRLITIINGMTTDKKSTVSNTSSTKKSSKNDVLHLPEDPVSPKPIEGKKFWQEDNLEVVEATGKDGIEYRVYITCHYPGERGERCRYAIKKEIYNYGGRFAGDHKKRIYFWTLPDKESAIAFRASRKAWAEANKQEGK